MTNSEVKFWEQELQTHIVKQTNKQASKIKLRKLCNENKNANNFGTNEHENLHEKISI